MFFFQCTDHQANSSCRRSNSHCKRLDMDMDTC